MNKKEMSCYNTDASRLIGKVERVIFPKKAEDIQKIIKDSVLDIVPRGAGSNLVGGCIPNNSIVVDLGCMNKILSFDLKQKTVCVEAGISLKELNEKLNSVGFDFPIHPFNKKISSIGGMVAMNSLGDKSLRYGKIKDWIEEIKFINGRGELMKTGKTDLMDVCGMEGITGIIVEATLKIMPLLKRSFSVFQTNNIENILLIARRLKLEKEVVMLEFLPRYISKLLNLPEKYNLIIEFDSERGKIKGEDYESLSKLKDEVYYAFYSQNYYNSIGSKFFFDKLKDFFLFLERTEVPYFSFLGSGVVYCFFKDKEKVKQEDVERFIQKTDTKSNQYGIGLLRKNFIDNFEEKIIQRVKLRHDPFNKINKGKIIRDSKRKNFKEKIRKEDKILSGEEISASKIMKEFKNSEEKMQKFINIAKTNEKIEQDNNIKDRLLDYKNTFESELIGDKRKKIEGFVKDIEKGVDRNTGKSGIQKIDYDKIRDIMTNKFNNKKKAFDFKKSESKT